MVNVVTCLETTSHRALEPLLNTRRISTIHFVAPRIDIHKTHFINKQNYLLQNFKFQNLLPRKCHPKLTLEWHEPERSTFAIVWQFDYVISLATLGVCRAQMLVDQRLIDRIKVIRP